MEEKYKLECADLKQIGFLLKKKLLTVCDPACISDPPAEQISVKLYKNITVN